MSLLDVLLYLLNSALFHSVRRRYFRPRTSNNHHEAMRTHATTTTTLLLLLLTPLTAAYTPSDCPVSVSTSVPKPSTAPGYEARLVATGLRKPRGIIFDRAGNLLVVESGRGVTALTLKDYGGACVGVESRESLVDDPDVRLPLQPRRVGYLANASCS